jgi:hypothetical protein
MTTWGETNHDGEADRIYRERLFDPTLEAPFLDTTNTHLGRARRCLARACGTAPQSPATERAVRALDGRARALAYSATLSEPLRPERSCLGALRSDELLAHIMLFCAQGYDHFGDNYTIFDALACTNRMFRRAAASRSVVAAKRRMQHTVFRWHGISKPDGLEDALYWMYHNQTEVLELACAKRKSYQTSLPVNIGPAWRNIFCRPHPPAIDLCRRLRVLRLTGFSFAAPSWNGTHHMVDSPCLEELEFEFAWPRMQDHLLDSHGHQMHSKAASFVASHAADAHAFFQFMDRFTATPSYRPALHKLVLKNICLCAVPAPHVALWIRGLPALSELRITSEDCTSQKSSYYRWSCGDDLVRQFLKTFGRHETIVDIPETHALPISLPRLETIFLDCGVALGFFDKIIRRAGALKACQIGWQLPPEPPRTITGQNKRNNIEHRGRGASSMARTFGQRDWLAFCRTIAAHGSLRKLELLESSSLKGMATLRSCEVLRTTPALASAPMPPPSECVGLAVGRLLAATPRRARVLDLSAYKLTLPHAAVETLAAAAPALTVLMLGACSDQEIESVATVFGERLTVFSTKGSLDITDGAIVALCRYCPRLQILKLGDSPFLTDATLVLLADKGGLPRLKGFWAGSIRFSGAKMASINERNSAHERAYRGTYRDAPPFGSIFSGASGDEYGAWACEGPCFTGIRPRNTADVTDPRFVERCYNCGCFMCAKCDCAPEAQNACVACGVFCCSYCASNQYEAVLGLQYGSGRERPGPFCKACLPEGPGGYSQDDVSFQLRKYYVKN